MTDNYTAKVYGYDGKICASIKNVSINTAFNALPFMIEDAIRRGQGKGEWDAFGEELGNVTENSLTNRIRTQFWSNTWFDKLSNDGEDVILTIKVRLEPTE